MLSTYAKNNFLCQIQDCLKLLIFCHQLQREQDLPCKILSRAATIYRQQFMAALVATATEFRKTINCVSKVFW